MHLQGVIPETMQTSFLKHIGICIDNYSVNTRMVWWQLFVSVCSMLDLYSSYIGMIAQTWVIYKKAASLAHDSSFCFDFRTDES
jgi:hypothetical protein